MSELYQMTISGPEESDEIIRKGTREDILFQEKEMIEEYMRQGFTINKHIVGFSGRHPIRAVEVNCDIRKLPS